MEPIRCLSWSGWVEMRQSYLDWQRRRQQEIDARSLKDVTHERQEVRRQDDDGAVNGHDLPAVTTWSAAPDATQKEDIWYRGTILLLSLPPPLDTTLTTPPFSTASELTPSFLNRHLKPQLEQRVSESISYIHTYAPPSSSSTAGAAMVAIRTAHSTYASQLIGGIPALMRMPEAEEDAYWSNLPLKVRTAAHSRILALTTSSHPHPHRPTWQCNCTLSHSFRTNANSASTAAPPPGHRQQPTPIRHLVRLRIHLEIGRMRVQLHILLPNRSAPFHRLHSLLHSIPLHRPLFDRDLGDEEDGVVGGSSSVGAVHGSTVDRLDGGDGCVCIAHLGPCDLAAFEDEFGGDAEFGG